MEIQETRQGGHLGPSGRLVGDPPRALVKLQFFVDDPNLRGIPAPSSLRSLHCLLSLVKFNDYVLLA